MSDDQSQPAEETNRSPSEWVEKLTDSAGERALRVNDDSDLGPRYYAVIDGQLIHHPGTVNGSLLGVVGPTTSKKLALDLSEYGITEVPIEDTPFQASNAEASDAKRDSDFEASVSFRIADGPFTASWGDDEADIRTMVDSLGFGDDEGRLRLNYGSSMDPQFGSGTGLEIWIDQDDFTPVLKRIDEEWPGINIEFGGDTDGE